MKIQCPHCKIKLKACDESLGKKAKCPKCGQPFVIESFVETPAEAHTKSTEDAKKEDEICSNCGAIIGSQEQAYVYKDNITCKLCYEKFSGIKRKKAVLNLQQMIIVGLGVILFCGMYYYVPWRWMFTGDRENPNEYYPLSGPYFERVIYHSRFSPPEKPNIPGATRVLNYVKAEHHTALLLTQLASLIVLTGVLILVSGIGNMNWKQKTVLCTATGIIGLMGFFPPYYYIKACDIFFETPAIYHVSLWSDFPIKRYSKHVIETSSKKIDEWNPFELGDKKQCNYILVIWGCLGIATGMLFCFLKDMDTKLNQENNSD